MELSRQEQYFRLINELISCPNGSEPDVLNHQMDLIDQGLVETMVQVAMIMTHENNPDGARFLFHVARELAKQLGLYPDTGV